MADQLGSSEAFSPARAAAAYEAVYLYHAFVPTTGITSASLTVDLAKNTLVRRFNVILTATRAQRTQAVTAAQVRSYSTSTGNTAVIDFGVPRTLTAISVTSAKIVSVAAWTGAAFGGPFYPSGRSLQASGASPQAVFGSEVRSERFLVTLSAAVARLDEEMFLELPELPTDLEIRINGGAPVWTHPGAVQPTTETTLSTATWNSVSQRVVELHDALNALLADPLVTTMAPYEIKITTKVPGVLTIAEDTRDGIGRSVSYINRILFNGDPEKVLDFAEEGRIDIALPLPSDEIRRAVEEVRLTAIGNLPPERTMPAVGPLPAGNSQTAVVAELVIDAGHAASARLRAGNGNTGEELGALTAIRLPLSAEGDGAEVRVVLWSNAVSNDASTDASTPFEPLPDGISKPVILSASPESVWTRFEFPKPVSIDADNPPWVAVLASRGTASWALANAASQGTPATPDDALVAHNVVRRGGPNGPWEPLPAPFLQPGGFMAAVGRVRVAGTAPKESPIAPVLVTLFGSWTRVTPTVKGAPVMIDDRGSVNAGATGPNLKIVSRTAGTITLRDIDVVWHPDTEPLPAGPSSPATA